MFVPDPVVLDRLVRRAERVGYSVANQHRSAHLGDELAGAALDGLAEAIRGFDPDRGFDFEAFAVTRMHQRALDALRTWIGRGHGMKPAAIRAELFTVTIEGDTLFDLLAPTSPSAEDGVVAAEGLADLAAAIAALPHRERDALLAHSRGQQQRALAERWGITESAVSHLRARGRVRLAEALAAVPC